MSEVSKQMVKSADKPMVNAERDRVKTPYVYIDDIETPIGRLTIACNYEGICKIEFGSLENKAPMIQSWAKKQMMPCELKKNQEMTRAALIQLQEYFQGKRQTFDVPLSLHGTPFQVKVWKALQAIPFGETRSYRDIARAVGQPKAVRAIGAANNKNPIPIIIPCHRVIGSNGSLVGYGGGLDKKEWLLEFERGRLLAR